MKADASGSAGKRRGPMISYQHGGGVKSDAAGGHVVFD